MATSGGPSYTAPPGSDPGTIFLAGQWYPPQWATSATVARGNGLLDAVPLFVATTHTFQAMGINVTVAATGAGVCELGVYNDNGSYYPGALNKDFGSVVTTAVAGPTVAGVLTLTPGVYWLAALFTGATTAPTVTRVAGQYSSVLGFIAPNNLATGGWGAVGVAGPALPATFPVGAPEVSGTFAVIEG